MSLNDMCVRYHYSRKNIKVGPPSGCDFSFENLNYLNFWKFLKHLHKSQSFAWSTETPTPTDSTNSNPDLMDGKALGKVGLMGGRGVHHHAPQSLVSHGSWR